MKETPKSKANNEETSYNANYMKSIKHACEDKMKMKTKLTFSILMLVCFPMVSADFSLVVIPDTQHYVQNNITGFKNQIDWIRNNKEKENIVFVLHEGDIVNQQRNRTQWETANKTISKLDGVVPYILAVGNHDMGSDELDDSNDRDTTYYNEYFPYERYEKEKWYGDHMGDDNDNYYVLFTSEGRRFIIISIEFGADGHVMGWANDILEKYDNRRAIILTHSYLEGDDTLLEGNEMFSPHRYGIGSIKENMTKARDGQEMWDELVSKQKNIFLVLSGHVLGDGNGKLMSLTEEGNRVYQVVSNYQTGVKTPYPYTPYSGLFRLIEFKPEENKIYFKTYSPTEGKIVYGEDYYFSVDYDMDLTFVEKVLNIFNKLKFMVNKK